MTWWQTLARPVFEVLSQLIASCPCSCGPLHWTRVAQDTSPEEEYSYLGIITRLANPCRRPIPYTGRWSDWSGLDRIGNRSPYIGK